MVRFAAAALALAAALVGSSASGNELVLLDFWSPTCGPCMQMKPTVHSLVDAGYPIRQIDCSREPEMARQYGVTGIPCFVMLVNGREVDRLVGATSSERLQQMFTRAKGVAQSQGEPEVRGPGTDSAADVTPGHSIPWPEVPGPTPSPDRTYAQGPGPESQIGPNGPPRMETVESETARPINAADARLLCCSVRLRVDDPKGHSFGTGTIIDAREGEALVITCGHLFRESKGEGPISVELFEADAQGVRVVGQVAAKLLRFDLDRDVALLSIRPNRTVSVAPVAASRTSIERGDRVSSVGCSNGKDPTVAASRVTWLDRYQGHPNIEASGAPVEGRSGGGLFNDQGQLVGICYAADRERNEGLYAALESIHAELDRLGMQEIYGGNDNVRLTSADERGGMPSVVRGQEEPVMNVMPVPNSTAPQPSPNSIFIGPESSLGNAMAGLNATNRAALEEIMKRAEHFEVVCIVRPKEPGGASEVITLDDVSPEFIRALEIARQSDPAAPVSR